MSLEFTSVPPVPRGMNLAGPPLFIDDAYCRWMQDVLVDRPGQTRMRGPLTHWYTGGTPAGHQGLGAADTITPDGNWRGAVFNTGSSTTDGLYPSSSGEMNVFKNDATLAGTVTLPFKFNTVWDSGNNRWISNTIIDAKPALGGGVWIGVTDEYGVLTDATNSKQALMLWRGGGKEAYETPTAASTYTNNSNTITSVASADSLIDSGMFVFDTTTSDDRGKGRYLGVVSSVSGTTVTLEKPVIYTSITAGSETSRQLSFTSVRGFIHQHGRGVATTDGGQYITSGRLGSDAEGLFGAARVTIGTSGANHTVYAYRYSDHKFIGEIKYNGTVSNTQVQMEAATFSTTAGDFLTDDNYFIIRNDTDLHLSGQDDDTTKYSMLASQRIHDSQTTLPNTVATTGTAGTGTTATLTVDSHTFIVGNTITVSGVVPAGYNGTYVVTAATSTTISYVNATTGGQSTAGTISSGVYTPIPGIFNSTYANRQWFASVGNTAVKSDKFVNRVMFSGTDNPENVNLSPDASDSIVVPGREAIRGIAGSVAGLLVFVENKTYIIKGTNRQNFSLEELYPDGCLCTSSIVQVGGGVIWAGKSGIYYYDGVTVRNFTNQALGIFYTDGVHAFNATTDRIYAFVYNNYLIINFTKWQQSYALNRYQAINQDSSDSNAIITLSNNEDYTRLVPTSITFNIFLPTGAIGTLSNFTPRGFLNTSSASDTKGIMVMNERTNTTGAPTGNKGHLLDLSTIFTEIIDEITIDSLVSNDSSRSSGDLVKAGPDFYLETKQYNFNETTLRKWWRKILFSLSINNGFVVTELVDINNNSLVDSITFNSFAGTTANSVLLTLSGSVFPYTTTKSFVVSNSSDLSVSDYLKLTHSKSVTNKVSNGTTVAVTSAAGSAGTATLTVASHTFIVGDVITVAGVTPTGYNGTYVVTAQNATTISYANATVTAGGAGTVSGNATLTVASHGLSIGDTIIVDIDNETTLDGTKTITAVTTNTLSYASTVTVASTAVTGTVSISVYGYVVSIDSGTNTVIFRLTEKSATGTHTAWSIVREDTINNTDESGYFLIPSTTLTWGYYDGLGIDWNDIDGTAQTWAEYFGNKTIRYSKWIGVRQSSLGFKFYGLHGYVENAAATVPELITLNDWVFGLKPLRKGRN